jgi:hypothetical protein
MSNETDLMDMEYAVTPLPEPVNETNDKAIVISNFREVVASVMNEAQFAIISGRTPKSVIKRRPGKGGQAFSYVPHGYVTATLNKAFGFHWSFEVLPNGRGDRYEVIQGIETINKAGKKVLTPTSVIVQGRLTVFVHNPDKMSEVIATFSKDSTGEKEFLPGMTWGAHIKAAESDALKRCAARLGIANDLYWADSEEDAIDRNGHEEAVDEITTKVRAMQKEGISLPDTARVLGLKIGDVASRRLKT